EKAKNPAPDERRHSPLRLRVRLLSLVGVRLAGPFGLSRGLIRGLGRSSAGLAAGLRGRSRRSARPVAVAAAGPARAGRLRRALGRADDRLDRLCDRGFAVTGRREQLLGSHARALHDDLRLGAGPFERLLHLGASRVRELRGLMARLLEEAGAPGLRLAELLRRVAVSPAEDLSGLVARGVEDLDALLVRLLADSRQLGLLPLELDLRLANLLFRTGNLLCRRLLCVALDRVGEVRRRANEVQRVHADGMSHRVDGPAPRRGLKDAEVRLERGDVTAEGLERLLHPRAVVAVIGDGDVLDPRQRGQWRRLLSSSGLLGRHVAAGAPGVPGVRRSLTSLIGWNPPRALGGRLQERDSELAQLFLPQWRGSARHRIGSARRLREGDDLPDVGLTGEERDKPLQPEREASVRRRAR